MRKTIALVAIALLLSACQMVNLRTSADHRQSLMTALDKQQDGYSGLIAETGETFIIQSTSANNIKLCRVVSIDTNNRFIIESFCKAKGGMWR